MNNFTEAKNSANYYKGLSNWLSTYEQKMKKDNETLDHYTSTEVLNALLKSATFWASNIFYLNDASEFNTGIKKLNNLLSQETIEFLDKASFKVESTNPGLYTISFSDNSDLLQQWITYAKESGVCVELDKTLLKLKDFTLVLEQEESIDDPFIKGGFPHEPLQVIHYSIYDEDKSLTEKSLKYEFNSLMYDCTHEDGTVYDGKTNYWNDEKYLFEQVSFLRLIATYFKNSSFAIEKEIRASFFALRIGNTKSKLNYFHKDNGILRPYCNAMFAYKGSPMLPLKAIVVGPSGTQQAVFDSVVHRIKYGECNVWDYYKQSRITFDNNFCEYVYGALERFIDSNFYTINMVTANKIFEKLKTDWEIETTRELDLKTDSFQQKLSTSDFFNVENDFLDNNLVERVYTEIRRNNYFTKEGVWIKKSQIPYIF
ncbi:MAG: DUF2971 domain-containing protein [Clostridia bacterium]|nr:DUF2971 domain-containing protein [Clostridia bacterium]